ncbi:MAG: hypothetical protein ACRELD_08440 [Longimicrobiales bacterium]
MVEVAAQLTDQVLPPLPFRQWVLSLPKRIRPFLPHDARLAGDVLRILLRAICSDTGTSRPAAYPVELRARHGIRASSVYGTSLE